MNLRTLKKLSKRAAPYLALLGDQRKQFLARKDENYTGRVIMERKHWERGRSVHDETIWDREIKTPARDGNGWVYQHPPCHPRKGTIMVGETSGYYEPEWSEETAYEALVGLVDVETIEIVFDDEGEPDFASPLVDFTPSNVFRMADRLVAERRSKG